MCGAQLATFYNSLDLLEDCTHLEFGAGSPGPRCGPSVVTLRRLFQQSGTRETLTVTPTRTVEMRICGVPAQIPPSDDTCAAQVHGARALEMLKGDREKGSSSGWPQQGHGQPLSHVGDLKTSSPMKDYWGDDHLRHVLT